MCKTIVLLTKLKKKLTSHSRALFNIRCGVICACAVVILVVAGPFGTMHFFAPPERAVFWLVVVAVSVVAGYLVRVVVFTLVPLGPRLAQEGLVTVLLVVLLSPAIWLIAHEFSEQASEAGLKLGFVGLYVFVVSAFMIAMRYLSPRLDATSLVGSVDAATASPEPRLARRFDPEISGPVLRLTGQDHHVQVATTIGVQMLRMRLADAVDEMDPIEGFSTHRSHWVARSAIVKVERESAHKTWIILTNGDRVPVSRSYRPELEAAGIL